MSDNEYIKFLSIIWQGKWINRMWFLTGLILIGGINRYSGILLGIIGLIIWLWVKNDMNDEINKVSMEEENNKKIGKISEDAMKVINYLKGYIIIDDNKKWEIIFINGSFQLIYPVCVECRITLSCNQKPPDYKNWIWVCDKCNTEFDGKSFNTEKQIALVKLKDEIDRAKKELGINESYRIAS